MMPLNRFTAAAVAMLALAACTQQNDFAPSRPVSEIKGKPIAQNVATNAPAAPQKTAALSVANAVITTNSVAGPAELNGYTKVGFDKLASFHYVMPDEVSPTNQPPKDQFPPAVKSLHDKPVALRGFMLPLKIEQGLVTEMLIMKDQSACCYGATPKITDWVNVRMNTKGVKPIMDQPVTLFGKLHVGETRENGYLVGIYELDGEKMEAN